MKDKTVHRKKEHGQVLAEYAYMLGLCALIAFALLSLFTGFTVYGSRLLDLVSWEPDPPERSMMEKIMRGNF